MIDIENEVEKLKKEIKELKVIDDKLVEQNKKLKTQSEATYQGISDIVGNFAACAWIVVGIKEFINMIKIRTD